MPDFNAAWERKEQSQRDYKLALEHDGGDASVIDLIRDAQLTYIDAAHDAMQAGLELIARR